MVPWLQREADGDVGGAAVVDLDVRQKAFAAQFQCEGRTAEGIRASAGAPH